MLSSLPGWHVFSDEKNHASMIAGIKAARGATCHVFRHNDLAQLEHLLRRRPGRRPQAGRLRKASTRWTATSPTSPPPAPWRSGFGAMTLSRRGPRRGPLRPARRWRRRARRVRPRRRHHRGHPGQGLRLPRRLRHRPRRGGRLPPLHRVGLHLHHLAAAGDRRLRARQRPPGPHGSPNAAACSSNGWTRSRRACATPACR